MSLLVSGSLLRSQLSGINITEEMGASLCYRSVEVEVEVPQPASVALKLESSLLLLGGGVNSAPHVVFTNTTVG